MEKPEGPLLPSEPHPKVSIRHLDYLNRPKILVLMIGTISFAANGAIFPAFGVLISSVISLYYKPPAQLKNDMRFWAIILVVLIIASFLVTVAQKYFFSITGSKLIRRIRLMCFDKVVHIEVGWFDESAHSSGVIGARFSIDAVSVHATVL
ncbi:hypothetical protein Ddye_017304 [Dipteronia dyeriana]|uniref:ABC transmembrane type-1 domain-containing protein n=1 Tax=Dipteronia dyeriana TaxID=168575 RepID=A0AAD9X1C2_9ROSI|nr:hypothetical protein Ddye_017304 [Dipteronia dyeriana]